MYSSPIPDLHQHSSTPRNASVFVVPHITVSDHGKGSDSSEPLLASRREQGVGGNDVSKRAAVSHQVSRGCS